MKSQGAAYAQITPLGLNPEKGNLSIKQFELKNAGKWARTSPGTLGGLLNSNRKPPPVIGTASTKSYASMNLAAMLIAEAARSGTPVPDGIWNDISSLPEFRVDRGSFGRDGYDVIFMAWLKDTDGREREVWARVGTVDTSEQGKSVEEKLFQAIADLDPDTNLDLDGGGKVPPHDPPPGSQRAEEEGPGDGKRGKMVVNRISTKAVAVFAATKDEVTKVGRISS